MIRKEPRYRCQFLPHSNTALASREGALERSITTCAPAMASLSPSPVTVLTPPLGDAATKLVTALAQNGDGPRADDAGAADHDYLHGLLSFTGRRTLIIVSMRLRSRITPRHVNSTSSRPSLGRRHLQPALHRQTREATVERRPHMTKAIEADELARFVNADQVAHPTKQRNSAML